MRAVERLDLAFLVDAERQRLVRRVHVEADDVTGFFLELRIDRTVAMHLDLHLIVDNYITHKTDQVKAWLERHPRFKLHFIPTSSSWLNLVSRFFAEITGKRIRRGVFKSVAELEAAIHDYLAKNNASPKPFVWTKTADIILEKNERARAVLSAVKSGSQALKSEHWREVSSRPI